MVCGGADSLSGDRLGCFNLSLQVLHPGCQTYWLTAVPFQQEATQAQAEFVDVCLVLHSMSCGVSALS